MEVVPLKRLGPFVLGTSAEEVRKSVKGPVISDEPETVDGQTYPATDLFPDRTRVEVARSCHAVAFADGPCFFCQYTADMKLDLVETPSSAVLNGKDLFKLGGFESAFEYVKKIDPNTTRDEFGFTAPALCLTAFCPDGEGKLDVVRVFTREHYERSLLEQAAAGLGDEEDEEEDFEGT
jgi:hypothetical protein